MPAIDPNKVQFTGENSFLRLRNEADGPETTVCAHWRTLISPAGPGTCLFLRSDASGGCQPGQCQSARDGAVHRPVRIAGPGPHF